ncbi:unnamed protein product [Nippostrongylus brasiliensis]|uniref:BPI2 domain-containing protein n=1 Tax=Nippostrongylus brasiliensis TaxID=27835 RepID=A0A0N4YVN1_NIPBR|nr:unnamed protein product [Nippostrongylus brasiliensis]
MIVSRLIIGMVVIRIYPTDLSIMGMLVSVTTELTVRTVAGGHRAVDLTLTSPQGTIVDHGLITGPIAADVNRLFVHVTTVNIPRTRENIACSLKGVSQDSTTPQRLTGTELPATATIPILLDRLVRKILITPITTPALEMSNRMTAVMKMKPRRVLQGRKVGGRKKAVMVGLCLSFQLSFAGG